MIRLPARLLAPCVLSSIAMLAGCGSAGDGTDVGISSSAVTSANNKTAFDYFVSKGLTDDQAAGIVGNLDQESGMDPRSPSTAEGPAAASRSGRPVAAGTPTTTTTSPGTPACTVSRATR